MCQIIYNRNQEKQKKLNAHQGDNIYNDLVRNRFKALSIVIMGLYCTMDRQL